MKVSLKFVCLCGVTLSFSCLVVSICWLRMLKETDDAGVFSLEVALGRDGELVVPVPVGERAVVRVVPKDLLEHEALDEAETSSSKPPLSSSKSAANNKAELSSKVECCGSPLNANVEFSLISGCTTVINTWSVAKLYFEGSKSLLNSMYKSSTSHFYKTMTEYHCFLHSARLAAQTTGVVGPRVVLCGKPGTGKHTLLRTLGNLAARTSWHPTLVDLSLETQSIGLPQCIGAASLDYPLALDETYDNCVSLCYMVGRPPTAEGMVDPLYRHYTRELLQSVVQRLQHEGDEQRIVRSSGCLVLVPYTVGGIEAAEFVRDVVETIDATHVCCIGDAQLFAQLHTAMAGSSFGDEKCVTSKGTLVHTCFLASTTSPMMRSVALLRSAANTRCSILFNGAGNITATPMRVKRRLNQVVLLRLSWREGRPFASKIEGREMHQCAGLVAAVVDVAAKSSASLFQTPVLAFAQVISVDVVEVIVLVAAVESALPTGILTLVVSDFCWTDESK